MDQKSVVCSAQPAHMQYDTIYIDVTPPSFLMTIILPWQVVALQSYFSAGKTHHPHFKIRNWIKSVSHGQQVQ